QTQKIDFFVFGHRHLPIDFLLNAEGSRYINLGDWIRYYTYAVLDGGTMTLLSETPGTADKIVRL
ncbi:MAG TPA: UDP-2,3-diacylglucosamine diphosphatase, partial [Puia sp.]|nr:UDP-2,3-diacylglucosamine diphosphatase [Puia sp.]